MAWQSPNPNKQDTGDDFHVFGKVRVSDIIVPAVNQYEKGSVGTGCFHRSVRSMSILSLPIKRLILFVPSSLTTSRTIKKIVKSVMPF